MQNEMFNGGANVDITASRDLVRGFQRRLRGVVAVPASMLALDVISDNFQSLMPGDDGNDAADAGGGGGAVGDRRQSEGASGVSRRANLYVMPGSGAAGASSSSSSPSLKQSLLAAVNKASASSFVDSHEASTRRLSTIYKQHRQVLATKFHPEPRVLRAQREVIPVILDRDCASVMRHLSTTRCYYSAAGDRRDARHARHASRQGSSGGHASGAPQLQPSLARGSSASALPGRAMMMNVSGPIDSHYSASGGVFPPSPIASTVGGGRNVASGGLYDGVMAAAATSTSVPPSQLLAPQTPPPLRSPLLTPALQPVIGGGGGVDFLHSLGECALRPPAAGLSQPLDGSATAMTTATTATRGPDRAHHHSHHHTPTIEQLIAYDKAVREQGYARVRDNGDGRPGWTFVPLVEPRGVELLHRRRAAVTPPRPFPLPMPRDPHGPSSPAVTTRRWQVCYAVV